MDNHVPPLKPWGFGVFVNDADGAGRKGYLEWGSVKSLAQMQPMTFKSL
jgi:hypothetical protein